MSQELFQHSKIGQSHIHRITNWRFQTTESRLDIANNFVALDIDKTCFDIEDGCYYILSAVNPSSGAPTWYRLATDAPELQGESNTASNIGSGIGVFKQKIGVDLEFKSIKQGANTVITVDGDSITFAAVIPDPVVQLNPDFRTRIAASSLGGHRAVSDVDATHVAYLDPTSFQSARKALGITTGAAASGGAAQVQVSGVMTEPSWTWTPNQDIWVSPAGILTQTLPTSGYLIRAGMAVSSTSMQINFDPIIQLA